MPKRRGSSRTTAKSGLPRSFGVGRLRSVERRPLLRYRRKRAVLAGDPLYRKRVHRHLVQPGIEALRPARNTRPVLREERIEETNLRALVFHDPDPAVGDRAPVGETRIAFESPVVEHLDRLVDLETGAYVALDIEPKVSARGGVVHADHVAIENMQKRHDVRP